MPPNIPSVPIDNISFHCVENADRWKFVVKRRLAVERNLSEEFLKCQDIMSLIEEAGLIKTVSELGKCYEKLTREFLVNIPTDCDNPLSPEYLKVFVRGKCVEFSPAIINQHLCRCVDPAPELEVSINDVWPKAGKLSAAKLTTKYALLNKIVAANWVPTTHSNSVATGLAKLIYAI
ncbi:envelope-like protein, partial [Trifolium pratense]